MARFAPKNTLPALGGLLGAALLIGYAPAAAEGAMRGLSACGRIILPAVFPFLAVSVFLAGAPGGVGLAALLSGVMRYCFRLPAAAAPALLMSWIGGYPAGAKTLAELRRQGALTARETEEAAPVLIYSGPAYMAGVVGGRIFGSTVVGIFLFLCQLAAGLLLGRLFAWGRPLPPKGSRLRSSPKTEPAAVLLVRSVGSAASSAVNICAFVVLLSAFAEVFSACGLFPLLERGLALLTRGGMAGETAHCFFTGLLEICAGSALAAELPPTEAGKILPFLLSFGGLSVCCQVSACFGEEPLSWGKLLWGRLLHGLLTALLAVPWLKRAVLPAMTGAAVPAFSVGRMLWGSGAMVLLCLLPLEARAAAAAWDGTVDISWYDPAQTEYTIDTPAKLAGLAALVNGMADPAAKAIVGDRSYLVSKKVDNVMLVGAGGGNVFDTVYTGGVDFAYKTIYLTADLDMGGRKAADGSWTGPNWTPIGGKFPMKPQEASSDCLTLDTRFNGGGRLHEDVEVLFSGKKYLTQVIRGKEACDMPSRRWNKPSIMITCEANYSNAHGTPWVYQHQGIGKVVGMPVPGTMTSVSWERLQDPTLVFGIPIIGYRLEDGSYLENKHLEPDIKVANTPETIAEGRDEQLETAVKELLRQIDQKK